MIKTDSSLRNITIAAIKRKTSPKAELIYTTYYPTETAEDLGLIKKDLDFKEGELPIASTIVGPADYTFVTTRKVIGKIKGKPDCISVTEIKEWVWSNFKDYRDKITSTITITSFTGTKHLFIIETGFTSMIMIYGINTIASIKEKE